LRVLITGGNGEFCKHLVEQGKDFTFLTPTKNEADIRSYWNLDSYFYLHQNEFDYVIHAAAITRPMVIHEDNPPLSIQTNIIGTSNVVLMCQRYKKKIIYISTDYVYDGKKGDFKETDAVKPFTKYGWSKLGGECAVKMYKNSFILRMAIQKKPFPHSKALIDMRKSYMFMEDAAQIVLKLLDETGIINVGGKSQSVYDFVREEDPNVMPITLSEISDVNMADDCSMNTKKMKRVIGEI